MADLGVTTADFAQILADFGRSVSYCAATKTTDAIRADESISYSSPQSKTWIFLKREQSFMLSKMGIVERGDAYIIMPASDSVNRGDRIIVDGETYEITPDDAIILRKSPSGTGLFRYATLRKVSGSQS